MSTGRSVASPPTNHFYRDRRGTEVDALVDHGTAVTLVEAKAGQTIAADFFDALQQVREIVSADAAIRDVESVLLWGGNIGQRRAAATVHAWRDVATHDWSGPATAKRDPLMQEGLRAPCIVCDEPP